MASAASQISLGLCQAYQAAVGGYACEVNFANQPGAPAGPAAPPIDPAVIARAALLRLPIPEPVAHIGPDPANNEWNMTAVGYPMWLWTDDTLVHTSTITEQGITLTLTARRTTTRFDTGDGNIVYCGTTTPWNRNSIPGQPSPTCGHTYMQPSLPETYALTATTHWTVTWEALGQTGTLPFQRTGPAAAVPVGELHAVRTR